MEEIFKMVTQNPNDMELGKKIRSWYYTQKEKQEEYTKGLEDKWIYESPNGGRTITKRAMGSPLSERIVIKDELIEDWYKRNET